MKISIITPTYNRKHFLPETIKSVLATRLEPLTDVTFEYIIFDDGSTDGTEELFTSEIDPRIRYIKNDKNYGQSQARNEAVREAVGEYILFLDSDDILLSRTLYNFASHAKKHPEAEWFVADFLTVDESLRYAIGKDHYGWDFANAKEMIKAMLGDKHLIQFNTFFKKKLFIDVGMLDTKLRIDEDLDLYTKFLVKGHMPVRCDFISHLHRIHPGNISKETALVKEHKIHVDVLRKKYSKNF